MICPVCGSIKEATMLAHNMTYHPLLYMEQIREKYRLQLEAQEAAGFDVPERPFACILEVTETTIEAEIVV